MIPCRCSYSDHSEQIAFDVKSEISVCLIGINDFIIERFKKVVVEKEPYPHLIVENILPIDLYYEALLH